VLRYAAQVNGLTALALGHLDVLTGMKSVQICTAYKDIQGNTIEEMPADLALSDAYMPIYEILSGWDEDLSGCREMSDLPANAAAYVSRVAELTRVAIATVSVGPGREQTILIKDVLKRILTKRSAE
jgi:adenylosuccinate synthase